MKKRFVTLLGASAVLALGQAAIAPAANAAPPSCLAASVTSGSSGGTKVVVFNGCSTTQKFVIAWDLFPDSPCYTLKVGKNLSRTQYTHFERLKSC
ncbi:hypothetical protein [Actinoplanes sp. M2I2]|uniref:hypothetical protein n=1 Tax=Actinoplanes sp. M2I2 TaxID=1734444 RepID=UPI0020226971|nr:hypothetical protein [Actinoplanes sp. M2I2]